MWRSVVSFKPQPLHPEGKIPGTGFSISVIRISSCKFPQATGHRKSKAGNNFLHINMNPQKLVTRNDGKKQVKQKEELTARGKVEYKPLLEQFGHIIQNSKVLQS